MNSGVITSSKLPETEELVKEFREAGLGGSLEWLDRPKGEAGSKGGSEDLMGDVDM